MTNRPTSKAFSLPYIFFSLTIFSVVLAGFYYYINVNKPPLPKGDGKYDPTQVSAVFHGKSHSVPAKLTELAYTPAEDPNVLGSKSGKEKRIEINLSTQKLYAYEGSRQKMAFSVSTGKWAETPTGDFRIWSKLKYTTMSGGSQLAGTYYYLPNVPYTMYFYGGYGIHGTYWHDNFGHPMSHGCVNMKTSEAEQLFNWASPTVPEGWNSVNASEEDKGTRVIIYGQTPNE